MKRLRKARRIEELHARIHQLAEHRLAALERRKAETERDRAAVLATLADDRLGPVLVTYAANRLRRIDADIQRLETERAAEAAIVQRDALRLKRAERLTARADLAVRADMEKKNLDDILEALAAAGGASLPPA
ncbi:hypothetical protein [Ancylobacter lacus]|uniref:hypothetical protein n=1 Tax=Ancylobacter lacus TaxID=2579970 RepID=UPI001BCE3563|nr:hypothetical protein [Ancylobacter lacus]MBS7537965.1 hypothetical protein [Ancylobacter lacus]